MGRRSTMRVVDLAETFGRFADAWSPKIVGDVNDMHVKVVAHRRGPRDPARAPRHTEHRRREERAHGRHVGTVVARRAIAGVRAGEFEGAVFDVPPSFYKLISSATRSRWYVASPKVTSEDFARLK